MPIEVLNNLGVLHFEREEFEVCMVWCWVYNWLHWKSFNVKLWSASSSIYFFTSYSCQLAERIFKEALGDGIWLDFIDGKVRCPAIEASASVLQYKDVELFYQLEREGRAIVLPWKKVTSLFNLARLLEQLHRIEVSSVLYRLILFKVCASAILLGLWWFSIALHF